MAFKRARSSITGKFVSMWYAIRHPRTTTVETVKTPKPESKPDVPNDDIPDYEGGMD